MIHTVERPGASRLADRLIAEFGTSSSALCASPERLRRALPDATHIVELLLAARQLLLHSLGQEIRQRTILGDDRAVQQYLFAHMAHMPVEQARILHLDAKNGLIRDDVVAYGTVDRVSLAPRELVRQALDIGATGMILAHNHPSGDSTPSNCDMAVTRAIFAAAKLFDIRLLDHIIVSRSGFYSFRAKGHF